MQYAVAKNPVIPVRIAPSEKSEMTNQILFGEFFHILEKKDKWSYISTYPDIYTGWISNNSNFSSINSEMYHESIKKDIIYTHEPITKIYSRDKEKSLYIPGGSCLSNHNSKNNSCQIAGEIFDVPIENRSNNYSTRDSIIAYASSYLGAPYLWGGKTIFGIDCSGFIQVIYRMAGISLSRDSSEQVKSGSTIGFIEQASPGDLAFFDNEEGNITHVGIITRNYQIIHASGSVRKDIIDHQGIFNRIENTYTHKLRVIKNIIGTS